MNQGPVTHQSVTLLTYPPRSLKRVAIIGTLSFLTQYPLRLASTSTKDEYSIKFLRNKGKLT